MKKRMGMLAAVLLACVAGHTLAAPQLTVTGTQGDGLTADGWAFTFEATQGGTLAMQLRGENTVDLGTAQVEAGNGRIDWDGLLPNGTEVLPGEYALAVQLRNFWGEESETALLALTVPQQNEGVSSNIVETIAETAAEKTAAETDGAQGEILDLSAFSAIEAAEWHETDAQEKRVVPQAANFWEMDPDAYDLSDPAHQQAIWELMMQPITVLDVGQTEHVYPTNQPGIKRTPYAENCAGELHGQSQGVRVVEEDTDGDGYVLIEAYSNDGTKTDNAFMESLDAQKIQGYVKKSLLFDVKPSNKYALLIDKLRQKLYIFEAGTIIGTLDISSGLNTTKQPYNETPAGEFITVSRVGDFKAGSRTIGRYAIRINGGTLLHEVLHDVAADGKTRLYDNYEPMLGMKASHACIRIQRRENAQGQNMYWLWNNLELKTKVFVWDDQGRQMYAPEIPDEGLSLYYNANGGSNYHLDANCSGVKSQYLPLSGEMTYGELEEGAYKKLKPCPYCAAPPRLATLYERYQAAAEQIGAAVSEEAKAAFGM